MPELMKQLKKLRRSERLLWAVGLFEGEGSFDTKVSDVSHSYGKYHYESFRMQLSSTDKDVLERFYEYVGIGSLNGPYTDSRDLTRKPYWHWSTSGPKAVSLAIKFLPFLGTRRTETFEDLMERN